ncbi:MAG: hypothetical protein HY717_24425 [Planctomycetes bacterium]|nr:hypothetical protein [Planctomycetota bacterium]
MADPPVATVGFSTFYLFATALSAGIAGLLPLVPIRLIGRKFFILMSLVAVVFYALAVAARGLDIPAFHLAAAGLLILFNIFVSPAGGPRSLTLLLLAGAGGIGGLIADAWRYPAAIPVAGWPTAWLAAGFLSSGALLGGALVAMVLGHWYLVARQLSFDALRRVTLFLLIALAARLAVAIAGGIFQRELWGELWEKAGGMTGFLVSHGVFAGTRALFGFILPAILSWMVWECVKIRSNQSATGILYVVLAFVLIGEIIAKHLLVSSRLLI